MDGVVVEASERAAGDDFLAETSGETHHECNPALKTRTCHRC